MTAPDTPSAPAEADAFRRDPYVEAEHIARFYPETENAALHANQAVVWNVSQAIGDAIKQAGQAKDKARREVDRLPPDQETWREALIIAIMQRDDALADLKRAEKTAEDMRALFWRTSATIALLMSERDMGNVS